MHMYIDTCHNVCFGITCRPTNLEPEEWMDEDNEEDDEIQDGDALDSADDMDDD